MRRHEEVETWIPFFILIIVVLIVEMLVTMAQYKQKITSYKMAVHHIFTEL